MVTDRAAFDPNDTSREMRLHHVTTPYLGEGCSSILNEAQLPGFVQRVDSWMARGFSAPAALEIVGLRGQAAAQVIAAWEAEP